MKKKIVITGISSSIVQKLALSIDQSKYEIFGITRHPSLIRSSAIHAIEGDLRHVHGFSNCLDGCHMLIHGAAVTHSRNKSEYYTINLEATKNLVEVAKGHSVEYFVFISSNTAGKESGHYGLTKLLAEEYLQANFSQWSIFRLSEVYGDSKKEGIEKLINSVIDHPVVVCPTGIPSKFYPIHVNDAVRLLHDRIFSTRYWNKVSPINGADGFTFSEVIKLTKTISNHKTKVIYLSKKWMLLVKWLAKISPISIGIVPDQIDRLYSVKYFEPNEGQGLMNLTTYIEDLARVKNKTSR